MKYWVFVKDFFFFFLKLWFGQIVVIVKTEIKDLMSGWKLKNRGSNPWRVDISWRLPYIFLSGSVLHYLYNTMIYYIIHVTLWVRSCWHLCRLQCMVMEPLIHCFYFILSSLHATFLNKLIKLNKYNMSSGFNRITDQCLKLLWFTFISFCKIILRIKNNRMCD